MLHGRTMKMFCITRKIFFPWEKSIYCFCHAAWLPCKTSLGTNAMLSDVKRAVRWNPALKIYLLQQGQSKRLMKNQKYWKMQEFRHLPWFDLWDLYTDIWLSLPRRWRELSNAHRRWILKRALIAFSLTWPLNVSEAGGDLSSMLLLCESSWSDAN